MKNLSAFLLILIAGLHLSSASRAVAQDDFWASPFQSTESDSYAGASANPLFADLAQSEYVNVNGQLVQQKKIALNQALTDRSSLAVQYHNAGQQKNYVLGYQSNNLTVSMLRGKGEDTFQLSGAYNGVDPYLFHGGYKQDFSVQAHALDYRIGRLGHLQYGQATVSSDGLLDRRARYMEWSNQRYFARASRFDRAGVNLGHGIDLGVALSGKRVAIQAMALNNDRRMQRIRFEFDGKQSRQYWIDFSAHQNPLFEANNDYRIMFNFKTLLGAKRLVSYQAEADEEPALEDEGSESKKKKKGGWQRAVLIGGGIAAAASLSSSGSAMSDVLIRFRTQNEAARDVLNAVNPQSIRLNREFGGWVFVNPDGSFGSSTPVEGEAASVRLPDPQTSVPRGSQITASYHTHGGFDPRFDNENFSPQDLENDRALGIDGYLGTPLGQFKLHDIETDTIILLGTIATE